MSTDQTKVDVYRPKVERSPREVAAASNRDFAAEEKATELAVAMACEDPTEREHLTSNVGRARTRLKAAAVELVHALAALVFAWLAQLLLNRSYKKLSQIRGDVGRAERSALALERLMSGFFIRRIVGGRRLLRALGASARTDDEGNTIYSRKLAERSYRICDGSGTGLASACDLPLIRVFVGVRVAADGEPVWCLKRFVRDEAGSHREVYSSTNEDADSAMLYFYMEPSHEEPVDPAGCAEQGLQPAQRMKQDAA